MKTVMASSVYLKGGSYYITDNPDNAFRVLGGRVFVYIVPLKNGEVGRRTLIHEAVPGEIIPAFYYVDIDYCTWSFCLVAAEEADIQIMEGASTKPLKERFSARIKLENYSKEGYENSLVDLYRMKLVREDGFIMRTKREKISTAENTDTLIASAFSGKRFKGESENKLYDVTETLCHYQKIPIAPFEKIKKCCGKNPDIFDIARISHFPCREIILENNWYKKDNGSIIAYTEDKEPVACIPCGTGRYKMYTDNGKAVRITKKIAARLNPRAYMIYRPLPRNSLSAGGALRCCMSAARPADIAAVALLTIVTALIGMLIPYLNQVIYDRCIGLGNQQVIIQLGLVMLSFMLGNVFFSVVKNMSSYRIGSHIRLYAQNAVYYRIFELPEYFFRKYDSADLAQRAMNGGTIAGGLASDAITLTCAAVSFIFYSVQMSSYSLPMTGLVLAMLLIYGVIVYFLSVRISALEKKEIHFGSRTNSVMYQLISGIHKVRNAGIEERAVYEYMKPFVKERSAVNSINVIKSLLDVLKIASGSIFALVMYISAVNIPDISVGVFVAFTSVMGMAVAYVNQIIDCLLECRTMKNQYERVRPILEAEPEVNDEKHLPSEITGDIDIDHIRFSYGGGQNDIFEDLSIHINAGEYVGIVGNSGCGKSTLLKLLLGFEKPVSGKIYYSNQDMETLDIQQLRKNFGVVLQDGGLISGSIYDNIRITAPDSTLADVKNVVRRVGLEKDIEAMPMGLHTVLSEDSSTISGGQKQRILIARSIINNPKIIFFDEATSALDNITQSIVSSALDEMNCTRIVIAHRLSTIKRCDRIMVLDNGRIAEEGTYESLMERKGIFFRLASRQII